MNVMGLSCGDDDFEKEESEEDVPLMLVSRETRRSNGYMDRHAMEFDVEFWPVEHPVEPQDEDRPVKCPMPTSSVIKNGRRHGDCLLKRADDPVPAATMNKEEGVVVVAGESPARAVRKRHHTLTRGDHRAIATRIPSLPTHNITIFQMLQEFQY